MVGAVLNTLHPLLIDSTNMYPTPRLMPGSVLEAGVAPRQFHVWNTHEMGLFNIRNDLCYLSNYTDQEDWYKEVKEFACEGRAATKGAPGT